MRARGKILTLTKNVYVYTYTYVYIHISSFLTICTLERFAVFLFERVAFLFFTQKICLDPLLVIAYVSEFISLLLLGYLDGINLRNE